ncbi:M24 family metallopeptidase [Brucella cytisi]|uniref:M24 family metallopeptidase n=1 Tax=Brucella cytisi TaxID=407152 RepID=UPI0035DEA320
MNIVASQRPSPLEALQQALIGNALDGYVVPRFDEHQGEYCAPHDNRLAHVTGFTGSAGVALVLRDRAIIFVDGRYQVQVRGEVDMTVFAIEHFHHAPLKQWLRNHVMPGQRIGFNPMLIPSMWDRECGAAVKDAGGEWVALNSDLVDTIWVGQPEKPLGKINAFSNRYAGQSVADKKAQLAAILCESDIDYLLEAQPDNIAWLLNVRGCDVVRNPMPQSFLLFGKDGQTEWLVDSRKLPNDLSDFELDGVSISDPSRVLELITARCTGKTALIDPSFAPSAFARTATAAGGSVQHRRSPITDLKMQKNSTELAGFRDAHRHDGAAWVRFLAWLDTEGRARASDNPVSELEAEDKILAFRALHTDFVESSFETISAAGPNAAMCHYTASAASNALIRPGNVYLLDSGGQYFTGTTDATRTTAFSDIPGEIRVAFTAVLKGLIAMLSVKFPKGTQGHQLDAFARRPLWALGLDYDHGTGHGVGHFLSVHEQPQRFDKKVNAVDLRPGMVTTIEPGYYMPGSFGIRLENQVEIVADQNGFMRFESLTLIPLDVRLANIQSLNREEIQWINIYHQQVYDTLKDLLDGAALDWLAARCQAI